MSTPKDGGPAFPTGARCATHHLPNSDKIVVEFNGIEQAMSLRDWFAGQAVCGYMADPNASSRYAARVAYRVADQMLKEREKGHK